MAKTTRAATTARRNMNNARVNRGVYVEGSAARRLAPEPERRTRPVNPRQERNRREAQLQTAAAGTKHQLSKETQRNREKAMGMNVGFVLFLAAVSAAVLFCSVNYLRYKSQITGKMHTVASLEAELAQLKEDNDAYYSQVTSNVDLNQIKTIAIGRLNMRYPSDDQTVTYQTEGNSYVRQYQDVPDPK